MSKIVYKKENIIKKLWFRLWYSDYMTYILFILFFIVCLLHELLNTPCNN